MDVEFSSSRLIFTVVGCLIEKRTVTPIAFSDEFIKINVRRKEIFLVDEPIVVKWLKKKKKKKKRGREKNSRPHQQENRTNLWSGRDSNYTVLYTHR